MIVLEELLEEITVSIGRFLSFLNIYPSSFNKTFILSKINFRNVCIKTKYNESQCEKKIKISTCSDASSDK